MISDQTAAAIAPQLGERPGTFSWWSLRQEFAPTPTRLRSAFKFALCATLVMVLAFFFNWPAALAMVGPLLLTRSDQRYDLPQAVAAVFVTWGMAMFYYWSLRYSQNLPLFILVLGGVLMVSGALGTLPGIGVSVNLGTAPCISALATYFFEPDPRGPLFLPIASQLLIGYLLALMVQFVLWPYSPRRDWDESFQRLWAECRSVCARWFADEASPFRPDTLDHQAKEVMGLSSQRIGLVDAADEGVMIRKAASQHALEVMILLHDLRRLGRGESESVRWQQLGAAFDRHFAALESLLAGDPRAMAEFAHDAAPPDPLPDDPTADGPASELLRNDDLRRLWTTLNGCAEAFRAMAFLRRAEEITQRDQRFRWVLALKPADLRQLGTAQPWRNGAKVALLVFSSLLFWQAFRWPNGATILASALIVNLPDLGSSARKAITRVYGLLLGISCALVCTLFVVRYVETVFGYGLTVFGVLLVMGYLSGASSRVNYVGFQGAISFVLTFIGDDRQSVSLEALRGRFLGLVAGVVIAEIILFNLWPVRKAKEMFVGLADSFAVCARFWAKLFQGTTEQFQACEQDFADQYNRGFAANVALNDSIEFEGRAGSARYGYAGRLLVHEIALYEQMRLVGLDWARLVRSRLPLPDGFDTIRQRFHTLASRLGRPVDLPSFPPVAERPAGVALHSGERSVWQQRTLDERLRQMEYVLDSMDRLTTPPETD